MVAWWCRGGRKSFRRPYLIGYEAGCSGRNGNGNGNGMGGTEGGIIDPRSDGYCFWTWPAWLGLGLGLGLGLTIICWVYYGPQLLIQCDPISSFPYLPFQPSNFGSASTLTKNKRAELSEARMPALSSGVEDQAMETTLGRSTAAQASVPAVPKSASVFKTQNLEEFLMTLMKVNRPDLICVIASSSTGMLVDCAEESLSYYDSFNG